jgi:hypothetical protein
VLLIVVVVGRGLLFADLGVVLRELEEGFKGLWIPDQRCSIRQTIALAGWWHRWLQWLLSKNP